MDASTYQKKTEEFRKNILLSIRESRVDDWVADRMLYVVDYLDTLLFGFFAFQDVLMERFGDGGDRVAELLKDQLRMGLEHTTQQHLDKIRDFQKQVEAWVEGTGRISQSMDEAIQKLPEKWVEKRFETAIRDGFPVALKRISEQITEDPDFQKTVVDKWSAQSVQIMKSIIARVTKTQTDDDGSPFLNSLMDLWQKQVLDTLNKKEMLAHIENGIKDILANQENNVSDGIRKGLIEAISEPLKNDLKAQLSAVAEESIGNMLETFVGKKIAEQLDSEKIRKLLENATSVAITAHMTAHPPAKELGTSLNAQTSKLVRIQEQLDEMAERLKEVKSSQAAQVTAPTSAMPDLQGLLDRQGEMLKNLVTQMSTWQQSIEERLDHQKKMFSSMAMMIKVNEN